MTKLVATAPVPLPCLRMCALTGLVPAMRRELFAPGQPLGTSRYFFVIPDGLGRGGSSKPSGGMHARFPHYGDGDVVETNHRLLVEGLHIHHLRLAAVGHGEPVRGDAWLTERNN
jgi:hypothetical protein